MAFREESGVGDGGCSILIFILLPRYEKNVKGPYLMRGKIRAVFKLVVTAVRIRIGRE